MRALRENKQIFRNVKGGFFKACTWDDLEEFFVRDKTELQNAFRQNMLGRFEDGEERGSSNRKYSFRNYNSYIREENDK